MPFTSVDFHDLVDSDVWVLEQLLTLPSDPEPVVTKTAKEIRVEIVSHISMSSMQDAVRKYRSGLLPAIFVLAQKVYAELFRVVLATSGHPAGGGPFDVQQALQPLLTAGCLSGWHPFTDAAHLALWWDGRYKFSELRRARNQVLHGHYSFTGGRLWVVGDSGAVLLDWSAQDTLDFTREVLDLAKHT